MDVNLDVWTWTWTYGRGHGRMDVDMDDLARIDRRSGPRDAVCLLLRPGDHIEVLLLVISIARTARISTIRKVEVLRGRQIETRRLNLPAAMHARHAQTARRRRTGSIRQHTAVALADTSDSHNHRHEEHTTRAGAHAKRRVCRGSDTLSKPLSTGTRAVKVPGT